MICRYRSILFTLLTGAAVFLTAAISNIHAAEPADKEAPSGWNLSARTLSDDALITFRKQLKTETDAVKLRELKLGTGLALLNAQPKTDVNLDEAFRLFGE